MEECLCNLCCEFYKNKGKETCQEKPKRNLQKLIHLYVGDRVLLQDERKGTVRYVGTLGEQDSRKMICIGIQLDERIPQGHTGIYKGKQYFVCPAGHGCFVAYSFLKKIIFSKKISASKRQTKMFPNFEAVQERRKERAMLMPEMLNWSPIYASLRSKLEAGEQIQLKKNNENQANHQSDKLIGKKFEKDENGMRMKSTVHKLLKAYDLGKEYVQEEQEQQSALQSSAGTPKREPNTPRSRHFHNQGRC